MSIIKPISRRVGDYQVTALSDGNMSVSLGILSGIDPADADERQRAAGVADPQALHINAYLIRGRERTILVDSGTGGRNNAGGQLPARLRQLGIAPADVDTILLTHGHPDHIGGLLDADGEAVYKNARLYLHPREIAYWQDDVLMMRASERVQGNFALFRRTLAAYEERVNLLTGDEVLPGIHPVWLPGHTPGHSGFRIDAGDKPLLIWGDIVHFPHIQSALPAVAVAFDADPAEAADTRRCILAQAAGEQWLIAGMHLTSAGFARLEAVDDGYRIAYQQD
ncbi:N-acyl homoserine lactonase AiiB [Raoultella terrigena]|uniref:MBL fold metallo-hydrolase n=1 Tax=Raoultella terrigena TaxID=577 RepID=UPI000E06E731|nr:MBL fold metallo-hydrolase [Raoultella terrigena]SUQ58144.1 N-acyl homoserine lactonase AiiB [Raoultella terrigena]